MKIGLLFPSIYASPTLFGDRIFAPRELLTALSNGLVERGHEVTVFSTPDVETNARVQGASLDWIKAPPPYYKFRGLPAEKQVMLQEEYVKYEFELDTTSRGFRALEKKDIDVLHVYHDTSLYFAHYLADIIDCPVLYTLHDPLPPEGSYEYGVLFQFAKHNYVSISQSQRKSPLSLNFAATVYHGVSLKEYPFSDKPGDAFLVMGRLTPDKGLHTAMQAAAQADVKLTISTNVPKAGEKNRYFEEEIGPFLSDPRYTLLSVVDRPRRMELYRSARALLFPIAWEEPFGMVMIEAMACGTPVIAYSRGSVPEIVIDGVTGFIINSNLTNSSNSSNLVIKKRGIEGLIEAIHRIGEIDRAACRKHVEEHFSLEKMVEGYEKVYLTVSGNADKME